MYKIGVVFFILFVMVSSELSAQNNPNANDHPESKHVPLINAEFKIDGEMNEPEWQQALIIPLATETSPAENIPAKVKTNAYFIDRGNSLLIGFIAEDSEPEKICLLYTSPSPRDLSTSRMPSSA